MRKITAASLLLVVAASACAPRRLLKAGLREGDSAPPAEEEPSMRNAVLHSVEELKTVHFDYDSAALSSEALGVLQGNVRWLQSHPDIRVQVAGHCDQRGTEEYNLALGQRRAQMVKEHYLRLGVGANRVATISYGREKPLCRVSSESCWRKNRRAETWGVFPRDISYKRLNQ